MSSRKRKSDAQRHDDSTMISPLSRHTRSKEKNENISNTKSSKKSSTKKAKIDHNDKTNSNSSSIQRNKKVKEVIADRMIENNTDNIPNINNAIDINTNSTLSDQQEMQKLWTNEAYHIAPVHTAEIQNTTSSLINYNSIANKGALDNNISPSNTSIFTSTSSSLPSLFLSNISASRKKSPSTATTHSLPTPIAINRVTSDPIRIMSSSQQIIEDNSATTPTQIRKHDHPTTVSRILNIFTPASMSKVATQIESSRKSPIFFFWGMFIIFSLGALSNHMAKTVYMNVKLAIETNSIRIIEKQRRLQSLDALEKEINLFSNDIKFEENQLIKINQLISPIEINSACSNPECILQRTIELERNISLFRPSLTRLSNSIREDDSSSNDVKFFSINNEITELVNKINLHDQHITDEISSTNSSLKENEILLEKFDTSN